MAGSVHPRPDAFNQHEVGRNRFPASRKGWLWMTNEVHRACPAA